MDKIKIILDIANNSQGSVEKGKEIIKQHSEIINQYDDTFDFYIKFQLRQLDSFIHPDYKEDFSFKYIKRFSETKLSNMEFLELKNYAEELGFKTIATPFDGESVDLMCNQGYNEIKIASCSNTDWSLLERVAETKLPVILSTAGISFKDLDNVVLFFKNKNVDLSLMHCRAEYPTEFNNLELNRITLLKERYPDNTIGYSTHEQPENFHAIEIAIGKGAIVLERHVDIDCDTINKYSSTPYQILDWINFAKLSLKMCGELDGYVKPSIEELNNLHGLRRGMFVSKDTEVGTKLTKDNVFFAIPLIGNNHYSANDFSKYNEFITREDLKKNDPVLFQDVSVKDSREEILNIVKQFIPIIKESGIVLPDVIPFQLSHHYGIAKFNEIGAAIVDIINTKNYCKKYIIMLPNQEHPFHSHKQKTETFHILYGSMILYLEGVNINLTKGDLFTVEKNYDHSFETSEGVIFEEISTQHFKDDSYYLDEDIINNKDRKTEITLNKGFFV